jgi:Tol biopolymer transport system component
VHLPEIAMTTTYPGLHGGSLTLSTESPFAGHADFWNTWQPGAQASLVDSCLRAARECGDYAGPDGAEPLLSPRPPAPSIPSAASSVSRLSPAGDATTYAQAAAVSADGAWVAYERRAAGRSEVVRQSRSGGSAQVVSVSSAGVASNGDSYSPTISGDGRYVAFVSDATNLVAGDTNRVRDVFVRDTLTGRTTRVTGTGGQPNGASVYPKLSDDGRFLAFTSLADNIIAGDTNRYPDVFRYALGSGAIDLVSTAPGGVLGNQASSLPDISPDGRWVAFSSWARNLAPADTNRWSDVFVRDMSTGQTELASLTDRNRAPNSSSYAPSISDDGRYVAFESAATNLVTGDKGARDVFVRDRATGQTTRISGQAYKKVSGLSTAAEISGDGSTVLFQSSNLRLARNGAAALDVYAACPDGSGLRLVSSGGDQPSGFPSVDRTGSVAAFESTSATFAPGATAGDLEVYAATLTAATC